LKQNACQTTLVCSTHDDRDGYDVEATEATSTAGATVAVYEAIDTSDLDVTVLELAPEKQRGSTISGGEWGQPTTV
jgi:hypothetical protein